MGHQDVYFQFPIAGLRLGKSIEFVSEDEAEKRFQDIVSFCLIDFADKHVDKVGMHQICNVANDYLSRHPALNYPQMQTKDDAKILFSADRLNVLFKKFNAETSSLHRESFQKIAGMKKGTMQVRLRSDVFWDMESMGWRDWSILCGVYAMLSNRPMVKLSYATINALALGYNGQTSILKKTLENHRMTDRKTQTSVERLIDRDFFCKASPNRRHNFYSMKPIEDLVNMLVKKEAAKVIKKTELKAADQTKRIRDEISRLVEQEQKTKSRSAPNHAETK